MSRYNLRRLRWPLAATAWLLLPALGGCDLAPPLERTAGSELTRPLVMPFEDPASVASKPPADGIDLKQANELLDKFMARKGEVFLMDQTDQHLDAIEDFALRTGRYFELVRAYREVYDNAGAGHFTSPRLAWAYVNLGQQDMARALIDESLKKRPNDPRVLFIHGYLMSREAQVDKELIRTVRGLWIRALSIDPELKNLYPVSARILRDRITEMNQVLGDKAEIPSTPQLVPEPSQEPQEAAPEGQEQEGEGQEAPPVEGGGQPAPGGELSEAQQVLIQAESALASGDAKGAYPMFQRVINAEPDNTRAYFGRAMAGWKAIGQMDQGLALKLLVDLEQRQDLSGRQLYELGNLYLREVKDKGRARGVWERALKADPDFAASVQLAEKLAGIE